MHELDHNGLASAGAAAQDGRWQGGPGQVKRAGQGRAGRALAPALSRKCHEMRANGATIGDVLLRMGPGRTNPSPSPKRVQAPNRVQAPKRSRHHVFPAGTNYYLELSPYVALSFSCVGFHRGKSAVKLIARQIQKTRHRPRFRFRVFRIPLSFSEPRKHSRWYRSHCPMVRSASIRGRSRSPTSRSRSARAWPRPPWAAWRSTAPSPSWSTPATASSPMRAWPSSPPRTPTAWT